MERHRAECRGLDRKTRPERFVLGDIDLPVLPVVPRDGGMMERRLPHTPSAGTSSVVDQPTGPDHRLAGQVAPRRSGLGPLVPVALTDQIVVTAIDGRCRRYRVTRGTTDAARHGCRRSRCLTRDGRERLVVITCGGPSDRDTGYRDNIILTARPVGSLAHS